MMVPSPQQNKTTFKVVLVGDSSVGKTHIVYQFVQGIVPHQVQATIGVDFQTKTVTMPNNESVKLSFFDTAGEEKYHAVTACHYRKAKGAVIVYDVTNRQSFDNVERWYKDVQQLADNDCVVMIMGNKNDVDRIKKEGEKRVVSTEEGIQFARYHEISFFEVSAIENYQIGEAMEALAQQIFERHMIEVRLRAQKQQSGVKITRKRFECCISGGRSDEEEKQSKCC